MRLSSLWPTSSVAAKTYSKRIVRKVTPRDTEPNPETFLLETPLSERAADGQPLRIVRSIPPRPGLSLLRTMPRSAEQHCTQLVLHAGLVRNKT